MYLSDYKAGLSQAIPALARHMLLLPICVAFVAVLAVTWLTKKGEEGAVPFKWRRPVEADPAWKGETLSKPHLHYHDASTITSYDPSSGAHIATFPSLSPAAVDAQIKLAANASESWSRTSFVQRRQVLRSLTQWIINSKEQISQVCVRDTGKGMLDAALGEVMTTLEKLDWMIKYGEHYLKPEKRPTSWLIAHKVSHVHYEPLGVVGAIVSWNYPFHNLLSPVIAALMSGNAIVIKTSENVAWSSSHFATAIQSCLEACGHDPNVVQVLIGCEGEAARSLTRSKEISHLTFIGSDKVGKEIAKDAAENLLPVTLELGGKDPCILLESADIDFFKDVFMKATFTAAGQGCIIAERYIVHQKAYDHFLSTMSPLVAQLQPGRDVGAMINGVRLAGLQKMVDDAVKQGARILVGGKEFTHRELPEAHYFEPTLLADVTMDMEIAKQECFAPIMLVLRAESTDDCIRIANSSIYGLGSSVFGKSKKDCKYVASSLQCGMVAINDFGVFYLNQSLPFGGRKASGYGRFGGPEGLRSLCNIKAVTIDRFFGVVQTPIPPPLKFPNTNPSKAWTFVCGLIDLVYAPSWGGRLAGIRGLISA